MSKWNSIFNRIFKEKVEHGSRKISIAIAKPGTRRSQIFQMDAQSQAQAEFRDQKNQQLY